MVFIFKAKLDIFNKLLPLPRKDFIDFETETCVYTGGNTKIPTCVVNRVDTAQNGC